MLYASLIQRGYTLNNRDILRVMSTVPLLSKQVIERSIISLFTIRLLFLCVGCGSGFLFVLFSTSLFVFVQIFKKKAFSELFNITSAEVLTIFVFRIL